jgi:hypothetical protein
MAEIQNYTFDYKEVAEALIKQQDIHEGLWGIYIEFGLGAGMLPFGLSNDMIAPAAVIPVKKIGIQRFAEPNSLTVDAAKINPLPTDTSKSRPSADSLRGNRNRRAVKKEELERMVSFDQ